MTLRKKVALALFLATAAFVAVDHFLHRKQFEHRYIQLDLQRAKNHSNSIIHGVEVLSEELAQRAKQAGEFSKMFPNSDYGWMREFANDLTAHFCLVTNEAGDVLYHYLVDPIIHEPIKVNELPNGKLSSVHPLQKYWAYEQANIMEGGVPRSKSNRIAGALPTKAGMLAVGGYSTTDRTGAPLRVYVGEFITSEKLRSMSVVESAATRIETFRTLAMSEDDVDTMESLIAAPDGFVFETQGGFIQCDAQLDDYLGMPTLVVRSSVPRELYVLWNEQEQYAFLSMLGLVLLCPFILLLLIQWIVTGPLQKLTEHSSIVANDQSTTQRLNMSRQDEIGMLSTEFDLMLDQLQASRREVIQTARQAGQSDISVQVLHNVGNMLNHASVSANLTRDAIKELPLEDLDRVANLLDSHKEDWHDFLAHDPQGKRLPDLIRALAQELNSRSMALELESNHTNDRLTEICGLIASLDVHQPTSGVKERIEVGGLLDTVVDLAAQAVDGSERVTIQRNYGATAPLEIDRKRMMEIGYSLVRNAMEAVVHSKVDDPTVCLSTSMDVEGHLHIEVADNGVGIDQEDITRVFAVGETLKVDRQGLGLHLASTAAMEMGGQLWAESTGLGYGAEFHLNLPRKAA